MFDGMAVSRGIDPYALPLDRLISFIYWWCTHNMDEKQLHKFDARLWIPPPGKEARGPWSAENETALFKKARELTENPTTN